MTTAPELLARLPQHGMRLGLERIAAACEALGSPQARFPSLLVAGTNGKGSSCAFVERVLRESGRKVGLYTSPHLVSFRERIRVGGVPVSAEELDDATARLLAAYPAAGEPGHPGALSYFEVATALCFDLFARAGVEVAVLEVGLGGRLDATNVPGTRLLATAVTRLGLDHTEHLGPDLPSIAGEKAAIARAGVPLISAPLVPAARRVLLARAAEVGTSLLEAGRELTLVPGDGGLQYRGPRLRVDGLRLGLRGGHQAENACVALGLLEAVDGALPVTPEQLRAGLAAARWPGRLEAIPGSPLTVLDGAHNLDGARVLADAFVHLFPGSRPQLVLAVLSDKERGEMMEALLPLAAGLHTCAPRTQRAVPAALLAAEARGITAQPVHSHESVELALTAARAAAGPAGTVLVAGSLYLVGEVRRLLLGEAPAV